MDANQIIKEMNNDIEKSIKNETLTLEKLDDLTFDGFEKITEILLRNVQETIRNTQEEIKKRMSRMSKIKFSEETKFIENYFNKNRRNYALLSYLSL